MTVSTILALLTLALAGCAASQSPPAASPVIGAQAECERTGGVWRSSLNSCEYQAPEPRPPR